MDADRKALESGVDLSALGARGWKAGFDVCDARDAVSALEVLKDCRPAMIVLDIQLPVWTAGN